MENQLSKIYEQNKTPQKFAGAYLSYLSQLIQKMDADSIAKFTDWIFEARAKGTQIFFAGNGGSAATASHFANDLGIGPRSKGKPFRALALTDNMATISAIGNDYGYEEIFVRQLMVLSRPGDLLVLISASGNSPNLLRAADYAKNNSLITIGLTGFDGGALKPLVDLSIHIPTAKGEYGPVEDCHMVIDHLVGAYLYQRCMQEG